MDASTRLSTKLLLSVTHSINTISTTDTTIKNGFTQTQKHKVIPSPKSPFTQKTTEGEQQFGELKTHATIRTLVRALHCCIHFSLSLGKKNLEKKYPYKSQLRFFSSVSPVCLSTSPQPHSSFLLLPLYRSRTSYPGTRTFKWKLPPLFFCPALSLSSPFTLLNCSSSQLSFPAVCLSTASPSSSTSPTFCLPAPLPLVCLF